MRKQTKLVAVLSAAALLAIGASMTSFADTPHWDMEGDEWVYLDRNGDKVTGEWKKSNGQWYYLDEEDGYMAKDRIVDYNEDRFYVNPNGVKVTNTWVATDNDDLMDDEDVSTVWFYFDSKGKAIGYGETEYDKTVKKLNYSTGSGYFVFDTEGCMLSGWQNVTRDGKEHTYYLGDENEGWARTGWNLLDAADDDVFDGEPYEEEQWFYFGSTGKAVKDDKKSIGGKYYAFDKNGAMMTNWIKGTPWAPDADATAPLATKSSYYDDINGIGNREAGWIYTYMPSEDGEYDDYWDDEYWFYLNGKGDAFNGTAGEDDLAARVIKGQTYLFGEKGKMLKGMKTFEKDVPRKGGADLEPGVYYFSEEDGSVEGQMIKNKKVSFTKDEEDITLYLNEKGQAYKNTIINGYVYGNDGKLETGYGEGSTYAAVELIKIADELCDKKNKKLVSINEYDAEGNVTDTDTTIQVIVNGNGKIKKSGYITIEGTKYQVINYVAKEVKDN